MLMFWCVYCVYDGVDQIIKILGGFGCCEIYDVLFFQVCLVVGLWQFQCDYVDDVVLDFVGVVVECQDQVCLVYLFDVVVQ